MGMPGTTELLIIFGIVALLFGAKQLPKWGSALGETVRNLRWSMSEMRKLTDEDGETDPETSREGGTNEQQQ